jgi:hypothetical protein
MSSRHDRPSNQSWCRPARHPTDEELVLWLDGELGARRAAKVRGHLESCWDCRGRREQIESSILAFVNYRKAALADSAELPPPARLGFERKLSQLAEESGSRPWHSYWRGLLAGWRAFQPGRAVKLAAAAAAAVALLLFVFRPFAERPVSAQELLQRAEQAEARQLKQVAAPVIYQKLKISRAVAAQTPAAPASFIWETWNDTTHRRFRQRVEDRDGSRFIGLAAAGLNGPRADAPALLNEIEQVMRANRMDARRPLSAASFAAWRAGVAQRQEEVSQTALPDGEQALTLTATVPGEVAVNQIIKAELVVRARDWRPVAERLKVQGRGQTLDYELIEAAADVVALDVVKAAIFADPEPAPTPLAVAPAPAATLAPPTTPAPAPTALPDAAELTAAEIEARHALHRAKADLGEQLEIVRETTGVVVRGLVETAERKVEVAEALRGLPLVSAELQTADEAARAATRKLAAAPATHAVSHPDQSNSAASTEIVINEPTTATGNALQQRLTRHFAGRGAMSQEEQKAASVKAARWSSAAISASEAALAEAWALRRLAERYAPGRAGEMTPTSAGRLDELVRDHARELAAHARRLRGLLEPTLTSLARDGAPAAPSPSPSAASGGGHWSSHALAAFSVVAEVDRLTHRLLAEAGLTEEGADAALRRLLAALPQMERAVESFGLAASTAAPGKAN